MKKPSFNSLTFHIWVIFISLIFAVFFCLFILYSFFYDELYDYFKGKQVMNYGEKIELLYEDYGNNFEKIEDVALQENLMVAIFTEELEIYNPYEISNLLLFYNMFASSSIQSDVFRDTITEGQDVFVYISKIKVEDTYCYIYVNTPIEPSTIAYSINETIILISVGITSIFAISLALFFSRYLSKPIRDLNDAAFLLSNGNYDVEFPDDGIDELKQLGDSLNKAKNEMKKTDELQKEFIANVSHDLRTPLTVIQSYAEMIKDLSGDIKEKREEHLEVIIGEVKRLSSLVTDVLEMTKYNADKIDLNLTRVNISLLVSSVLDKVKLPLSENKIKVTTNLDKKAFALVDETSFNQIIYNFILNAITYTKTIIQINVEIVDDKIHFFVIDDGIGIKDEELEHVWDRYYRSKENHERHKHGSGLGLSIVKKIVENHKFEYGVYSTYEKGSTFYVILPLDK